MTELGCDEFDGPDPPLIVELIQWLFIIVLVMMSGLFSGLNLGLMSLDKLGLEIVIGSGSAAASRHARRIYPIRRRGNLLLCTILLGNVAVNSLLSILLDHKTGGAMGFLISTATIVVFGEITPQAICSRHGLAVGYYTVWLVWVYLIVLLPIAWPIAKILDMVLGREVGTVYSRDELKKMVEVYGTHYASDLSQEESTILAGALDFGQKTVDTVMTPLDSVFMLPMSARLNYTTIADILQKGFSRIPVFNKTESNVIGLLLVKDLALVNPNDNMEIKSVLSLYGRNLPRVYAHSNLKEVLGQFKSIQSHIALVRRIVSEGDGDPVYENVGIITLEDIIEEILQEEIVDETDQRGRGIIVSSTPTINFAEVAEVLENVGERERNTDAPSDLREKAVSQLSRYDQFGNGRIAQPLLETLIEQCELISFDQDGGQIITAEESGVECTLIIEGLVVTQRYDGSRIEVRGGTLLAALALEDEDWRPDFDAFVVERTSTSILRIPRRSYEATLQASIMEGQEDDEVHEVVEVGDGVYGYDDDDF